MKLKSLALCALITCAMTGAAAAKPQPISAAERVGIILAAAAYGGKNCDGMLAYWPTAALAVKANGFTQADVNKPPIKNYVNRYILAFQAAPLKTTCDDLYRKFGVGGSLLPNLLEHVD
jgi:hypothetical protein